MRTARSHDAAHIHLSWLLRLRWMLYPLALAASALVGGFGRATVDWGAMLTLVGIGLGSNAWLARRVDRSNEGSPLIAAVLAADIGLLTAILFVTGGYSNPLSFLYLVEVALAIQMLGPRGAAWGLVALTVLASGVLVLAHGEASTATHEGALAGLLEPADDHGHGGPAGATTAGPTKAATPANVAAPAHLDMAHAAHARLHIEGLWIAIAVTVFFVARARRELDAREADLASERAAMLRHEKVASLATLAAGAAHELATPLSTIAMVARELERALSAQATASPASPASPDGKSAAADARLIREQVDRCRAILDRMAGQASAAGDDPVQTVTVASLIERTLASLDQSARVDVRADDTARTTAVTVPLDSLAQALRSTLHNALEASPTGQSVTLTVRRHGEDVVIAIRDQGGGMAQDVLARAGEPFFTTKEVGRGMGLGLFLSRAVLEGLGGSLMLESRQGHGTTATLRLPIAATRADGPTLPPPPGAPSIPRSAP